MVEDEGPQVRVFGVGESLYQHLKFDAGVFSFVQHGRLCDDG